MKEILFVCSGNTCRSPMAEGIARELLGSAIGYDIAVSSAGSSAIDGYPASPHAVEAAGASGIDITGHRSRLLNATMVRRALLIVTMGEKHRHTVGVIEPAALEYTVKLTDFAEGYDGDVADPFGGDLNIYQSTFDMIRECVEGLAERLKSGDSGLWRCDEGNP